MNAIPLAALEETLADIRVFEAVLKVHGTSITSSIINGLERWFSNVEIGYPVPEMTFKPRERVAMLKTISGELNLIVSGAIALAREEHFENEAVVTWNQGIDNLWRELARVLAPELNKAFIARIGVAADMSPSELTQAMRLSITQEHSQEEAQAFFNAAKSDPGLRTWLLRHGINPDEI